MIRIIIAIFIFVHCACRQIDYAHGCQTPTHTKGDCISINYCSVLHPLVKKNHEYLKKWHCGYDGNDPMVCCPPESEWSQIKYDVQDKTQFVPVTSSGSFRPQSGVAERDLFNNGQFISGETEKCGYDISNSNKITGGGPAGVDEYPWLVLLEYSGGVPLCGGSLISSRLILTAAHCISGINGAPTAARLGEYNKTSYPTDYVPTDGGGLEIVNVTIIAVEGAIIHPGFDRNLKINDIGIVKLIQKVQFTDFIQIVCLPAIDYTKFFNRNTNFTVAGWGDTRDVNDIYKDVKKHTTVPYVAHAACSRLWPSLTEDSQICAGGKDGKDTCEGDSGGPLMYYSDNTSTYLVVGITSYGHRVCGLKNQPAVYTNVFKYLSWIVDVITERIKMPL